MEYENYEYDFKCQNYEIEIILLKSLNKLIFR